MQPPDRVRDEDFGVYLHIPFCRVRCGYCDFNTYAGLQDRIPRYVQALHADLALRSTQVRGRLRSIYFGGGTPSLLPPDAVAGLVADIAARWGAADEVTLEANPGTVDRARLAAFRDAGVTRLTLGAQTFEPALLRRLGRLHDVGDTLTALADARAVGFGSVNLDLMFALPRQTRAAQARDLDALASLRPDHLSLYNLTIEPGTPFAAEHRRGRLRPPGEAMQATMHRAARDAAAALGLERYEVSNFAAPGHRCLHNQIYWRSQGWLGLGAGAHGYDPHQGPWGRRCWNVRSPDRYADLALAGEVPEDGHELLEDRQARDEALLLGLRTCEGLDRARFRRRFGLDVVVAAAPTVRWLMAEGLALADDSALRLTDEGEMITDSIVLRLSRDLDTAAGSAKLRGPTADRMAPTRGPP